MWASFNLSANFVFVQQNEEFLTKEGRIPFPLLKKISKEIFCYSGSL